MDDYEFIDEEIEDYTDTHFDFANVLSDVLNLSEELTFSLVTRLNPQSHLYRSLHKLAILLNDRKNKNMHEIGRKAIIESEATEVDRTIGRMTATFLPEIKECLAEEAILLPERETKNIDSFLYLINANYFEEIQKRDPNARREFLINQLLHVISFYLKVEAKTTFDDTDAKAVLDACVFIPKDIKSEIASEFKQSKVKLGLFSDYEIIRHDVFGSREAYLEAKKEDDALVHLPEFDINSKNNFIVTIKALEECRDFQNLGIGSAEEISWNVDFIQKIMKFIATNHHDELITLDEQYSNFKLVKSFLFDTMVYAVLNNIDSVTSDVAINSLANWDYLPFDLKLTIVDEIFEQENFDYSSHPFREKRCPQTNQPNNIIEFRKKLE